MKNFICHQHIRDDHNSCREEEFDRIHALTFFTSWLSPNLGHNMIQRLECSEVIVSKCMECLFCWFMDILEHIFNCYMVGVWLSAVKNTTGVKPFIQARAKSTTDLWLSDVQQHTQHATACQLCRHGTMSKPILNQYDLFRAEWILNESWTNLTDSFSHRSVIN